MLKLDDPRWKELKSATGELYDPRPDLARLGQGGEPEEAWAEFGKKLHHQGNVDTAAYAAFPVLVILLAENPGIAADALPLLAEIEAARRDSQSPELPKWILEAHTLAFRQLVTLALHDVQESEDPRLLRSRLSIVAMGFQLEKVSEKLASCSDDELGEMVATYLGQGG